MPSDCFLSTMAVNQTQQTFYLFAEPNPANLKFISAYPSGQKAIYAAGL